MRAGAVERGIVMPEVFVARGLQCLHDGAATLGDCGIYKIKGVGDVLVGRVERSRLAWEKAAGMRLLALRCGTCPECPHIIIISLFCSKCFYFLRQRAVCASAGQRSLAARAMGDTRSFKPKLRATG